MVTVTVMLTACMGCNSRKIPSLNETFSKKDKKPFGANIAYRQLGAMFYDNTIRDKKQAFTKTWQDISDTSALYICITANLFVNEEEVDAMMEFIYAGNDLFIAAGNIDDFLLKRIGCNEMYTDPSAEVFFDLMKNTATNSIAKPRFPYAYYYHPFQNYFLNMDSSNTRVVGFNENKKPNAIVYFHGTGKLFLHCEPRAFSNYFLLKENNYEYLRHAMAFTEKIPQHVYWDDHYSKLRGRKKDRDRDFSTLSEIMKHPPLVYAFWLSLILLVLYILFGGKRVQRIIGQLKPNENTTVTFTETIGRLYLQKKDNKNIADKLITYFNEYIRNKYFLNTNLINEDFITTLSRKSGVNRDKVDTLYRTIVAAHGSEHVNDYQLLSLQEQIQNFYKNTG